jgi:hypothetical protein
MILMLSLLTVNESKHLDCRQMAYVSAAIVRGWLYMIYILFHSINIFTISTTDVCNQKNQSSAQLPATCP